MENDGNDAMTKQSSHKWVYKAREETVKTEKYSRKRRIQGLEEMRGNRIQNSTAKTNWRQKAIFSPLETKRRR